MSPPLRRTFPRDADAGSPTPLHTDNHPLRRRAKQCFRMTSAGAARAQHDRRHRQYATTGAEVLWRAMLHNVLEFKKVDA